MGLALLTRVFREAAQTGILPAHAQDERFATRAPMIRRTVSLTDQQQPAMTSIVVTAIGTDRPGIVSLLSDRAARHGANWAASQMANHAGQFAGTVQLEVAEASAEPLAQALRGLDSAGLRVVVARSESTPVVAGRRSVRLDLIGPDRPAIVRDLSGSLAGHGVSIESLETEIVRGDKPGERLFKVQALLVVPNTLPNETLRGELGMLASRMMVDIALGDELDAAASA
jgi:glycine cleavage system regulatory protein